MQSLNPAILYLADHLPKQTHTHFSSILNLAIKSQFAVAVIQLAVVVYFCVCQRLQGGNCGATAKALPPFYFHTTSPHATEVTAASAILYILTAVGTTAACLTP